MQKLALFDMDGSLCDYTGKLEQDMRKIMSPDEKYDNIFDESKPWLKKRMDLIKSQPDWWTDLKPIDSSIVLYEELKSMGFDIEILTKGPLNNRRAWMEKGLWIDKWLGTHVPINIVGKDKSKFYGHVLVEDYPKFLLDWLSHRPRGLGVLIDNVQNRDFCHPNVVRYDGSKESLVNVKKYLKAVLDRKDGESWSL